MFGVRKKPPRSYLGPAVVQPGLVRARVAALQSAALGLVAMAAQPPLPPVVVGAVGLPPPPVVEVREQEVPLGVPIRVPAQGLRSRTASQ